MNRPFTYASQHIGWSLIVLAVILVVVLVVHGTSPSPAQQQAVVCKQLRQQSVIDAKAFAARSPVPYSRQQLQQSERDFYDIGVYNAGVDC